MRKIAGPGNVAGAFVDYDPINNPLGTVYTADWGNDVQTDFIKIQEAAGVIEAAGSTSPVLKSMIRLIKEESKTPGELFYSMFLNATTSWDPTSLATAKTYNPSICLSTINIQTTLDVAAWPDFVPLLRAKKIKYLEGKSGEVSSWTATVSGSVVTMPNNASANAVLASFAKDVVVHGSYTSWITLTIGGTEYAITNINLTTREITVTGTPSSGSQTVEFYPHRISGSTTTARLFEASGKTLISANDSAGLFINFSRALGYFQGHRMSVLSPGVNYITDGSSGANAATGGGAWSSRPTTGDPVTDGVNGTPRTGLETHSPILVGHLYVHGGRYEG